MQKTLLVSIIVTTKNEEENIENCLKSIKSQSYENIEIIVVDNNSSDKTKAIAGKYTKNVFNKGPERSAQRNFGGNKSKGEYLLFIDADMILSKKVVEECVNEVTSKNSFGVIIPEESFGKGFWAQCKKLERSFYLNIDWIESARFFPRDIFEEFKGYDENNTGTEDYDLPQRIKVKYGQQKISRINSFIFHNEGKASLIDLFKAKFYYGKKLKAYIRRQENKKFYKKQSNLLERYKLFMSKPRMIIKNPVLFIGLFFMKTGEFMALGMGHLIARNKK